MSHLSVWADRLGVPMLVGVNNYDHRPGGLAKYNSAVLYEPKGLAPRFYHKIHLVPFGEYVPLIKTFPWLTALTPYHGETVPSLNFGPGPAWFDVGPYRFAAAICFEDTVPQVVRRSVPSRRLTSPARRGGAGGPHHRVRRRRSAHGSLALGRPGLVSADSGRHHAPVESVPPLDLGPPGSTAPRQDQRDRP